MTEMEGSDRRINELINGITQALNDSALPDGGSYFKSWLGSGEISAYLLNTNKKHPIRGFVVEAAAIRGNLLFTFSDIAGELTLGTIMLKSIRSITASVGRNGYIQLNIVTDASLAFQMQLLTDVWDKVIEFKNKLEKLMEDVG